DRGRSDRLTAPDRVPLHAARRDDAAGCALVCGRARAGLKSEQPRKLRGEIVARLTLPPLLAPARAVPPRTVKTAAVVALASILAAPSAFGQRAAPPPQCIPGTDLLRSEEHTSELQSRENLVCRLL